MSFPTLWQHMLRLNILFPEKIPLQVYADHFSIQSLPGNFMPSSCLRFLRLQVAHQSGYVRGFPEFEAF